MTDSTGTATAAAGWYDDPAGTGQKRWWDGTQWTEHLHDPALEMYGAVAMPVVGAGTPVYNVYIWLVVLLPLVSTAAQLSWDMNAYMEGALYGETTLDGGYLITLLLGWAVYAALVVLAVFDHRRLSRDGYARPFHWAWSFLYSGVYVIGRSVIVRRRSGRGLLPIWVWIVVTMIGVVGVVAKAVDAMSTMFATMPSFS